MEIDKSPESAAAVRPAAARIRFTRLIALMILVATPCLWAGKEFTANPGETVVADQLIVKLQAGANINQILSLITPLPVANLISSRFNSYLLQLPPGIQSIVSKLLAASPLVSYVEPNRVRKSNIGTPGDPDFSLQWALTNIQALQAWTYMPNQYLTAATAGTSRVKVAVLDTGADCTHPDFKNLGGSSTDSAQGGQLLWSASQALVTTTISPATCAWQDDHGHGTHTAGIVAAATQNGAGVASVGYPLQVVVYKVLDNTGSGSDSVIAQAIEAAAGAGVQVVSMSLGGAGYSQTLQTAIDYAWQRNTLVVAAAGNTGDSSLIYPGAANHALGVGATDSTNTIASFSTFGNWVKIAAPGVNVLSTVPTYSTPIGALNYAYLSGTSMATPHVAGVAGLVYMANPNLSAAAVAQRLQRSAQTSNSGWEQHIGYGVLNAAGALIGTSGFATKGSLTGQVVDSSSLPVSGATVIANGQSFTTAGDGLFRIPNLTPGTYTLTANAAGFATVNMQAAVVASADTMMTVRMGVSTGEFTGTVTTNGSPVVGAVVEAVSGGVIQGTAISDANGTYALYLTAGTYDLTASAAGDINGTVAGQALSTGQTKTVSIAISRIGNITGSVKDSAGTPVANAQITIVGTGFTAGATSDDNGNFFTIGLPAGTYSVSASFTGFTSVTANGVSVSPNVSSPVTLQFSSALSSITAGLIGYWNFDEGSGTLAHDTSGSGYNGTINGANWVAGKINSALKFNGSTGIATPSIPLSSTFSVSAWVNPAVAPQGQYVRIMETVYSPGLYLGTNVNGSKYKLIVNGGAGSTGNCGASYGCAEGGTVSPGWHLVTATYDGAVGRLYVDGVLAASDTFTAPPNTNFPLYIGVEFGGSGFGWSGSIDDARLYNLALTGAQVTSILAFGGSSGNTPPSVPTNVTATAVSSSQINVSWSASTQGSAPLAGYRVYRNGSLAGTVTTTSFSDTGLTASTTYSYTVAAFDSSGNASNPSSAASATTLPADTTPPAVSITSPAANSTVSNTVIVSATATDNVAVADVQFQLDGVNLGADLTTSPYSISWNTTTASNGSHTLTAIAHDTSGNKATSTAVAVTVSNTTTGPPTAGLIGYWNFDEDTGTVAHDTSGSGHNGTVNNAAWVTGKINFAINFNGYSSDVVTAGIPLGTTFSIAAWVNSAVAQQGGYSRVAETQYSPGFYLGTNAAGTAYKFIVNGAAGTTGGCGLSFGCAEGGAVSIGWHLLTATFDGATAKLYVDGTVVGSDTFTATSTNLPLYIGRYFAANGNGWNGAIDEVRLYNRALSATEVTAILNYTGGGSPTDTTPPSVSITAPAPNATVSNTTTVSANATDNVAVADVQFQLDGVNLGADLTTAPYSISWNTTTASNGNHTLTAIARDTSGNTATSTPVTVTVSNTVGSIPTAGLIGYWSFDEDTGTIAHDTSGSGYNGTVNSAAWVAGRINFALNFNGNSSDVLTPGIPLGSTFSISAWVNPAAAQGEYARVVETQYSPGFYLGTNFAGTGYKFIVNGAAGATANCGLSYGCSEGGTVSAGWHLLTATFDGATAKLYVDGVLVGSDTGTATNTNLPLYIGRYFGSNGFGWNGTIDEVRLYNRALSATEVTAILNYTGGGSPTDTTPPTVSITAPASNATVSNTITVSANASDNVAVADVQFQLDGVNLGADLTTAPYSISWNTTTAGNGSHTLTAIARDTSGNTATSTPVTVTVSNTVGSIPTAGLIGYWSFDEDTGTVAHDTSGSGYNGTVNSAAWVAGHTNFALSFNGNSSDVLTPSIPLGSAFSISAWVNSPVTQQGEYARVAETEYSPGFYLGTNFAGTGYKFIVNGAAGATGNCGLSYGCAEGGTVSTGWHLLTATFDGATARLYVDGVLVGNDTGTPTSTNLPLYIGRYFGSNGFGWNGAIDEVRLYDRALTATEVTAIFNH